MAEFFNSLAPWTLVTSLIAVVAVTYSIISYRRNQKLRKEITEWKVGKETDQPANYDAFIDFFEQYSSLGGNAEVDFLQYASNSFKRKIQKSTYLYDLAKIFSGFRSDHPIVKTLHRMVKEENTEKVLSIAENQWEEFFDDLKLDQLNAFQEAIKADWCREYELSEIFYERIKKKREELTRKK